MCVKDSTFKHTACSTSLSSNRWRMSVWRHLISTIYLPQKVARVFSRLRYLPRGDMATEATIALDSRFNLRLMTRILVAKAMNCLCHVMIEVNGGCVCCWHQLPHVMSHPCMMLGNHEAASQLIAQRVETIHVEENSTHPSIINPLIEQSLWKCHNYSDLQHKLDEISSGNYKPGMLIWLKGSTGRCNSQTFICLQST